MPLSHILPRAAVVASTTGNPNATRALPSRLRGLQSGAPCFELPLDWSSERGQLLVNGRPFHLKGTNWCVVAKDK